MSPRTRTLALIALAAISAAAPEAARAHFDDDDDVGSGLYIGASAIGTHVLSERFGQPMFGDGGGIALYGGIDANENLSIEIGWFGTRHTPGFFYYSTPFYPVGDRMFSALTADLRGYLNRGTLRPFVQGGIGGYYLEHAPGGSSVGSGFQAGGGLDLWLGRQVAIGGRVLYRGLNIATGPLEGRSFIGLVTGDIGLSIHF